MPFITRTPSLGRGTTQLERCVHRQNLLSLILDAVHIFDGNVRLSLYAYQEELTATVLQQTAVLSENCKELSLFSTLKMEHQIQSKKHTAVVKRLHDSEEQTTILSTRLKVSYTFCHGQHFQI